jgi:hypothetical protein
MTRMVDVLYRVEEEAGGAVSVDTIDCDEDGACTCDWCCRPALDDDDDDDDDDYLDLSLPPISADDIAEIAVWATDNTGPLPELVVPADVGPPPKMFVAELGGGHTSAMLLLYVGDAVYGTYERIVSNYGGEKLYASALPTRTPDTPMTRVVDLHLVLSRMLPEDVLAALAASRTELEYMVVLAKYIEVDGHWDSVEDGLAALQAATKRNPFEAGGPRTDKIERVRRFVESVPLCVHRAVFDDAWASRGSMIRLRKMIKSRRSAAKKTGSKKR